MFNKTIKIILNKMISRNILKLIKCVEKDLLNLLSKNEKKNKKLINYLLNDNNKFEKIFLNECDKKKINSINEIFIFLIKSFELEELFTIKLNKNIDIKKIDYGNKNSKSLDELAINYFCSIIQQKDVEIKFPKYLTFETNFNSNYLMDNKFKCFHNIYYEIMSLIVKTSENEIKTIIFTNLKELKNQTILFILSKKID